MGSNWDAWTSVEQAQQATDLADEKRRQERAVRRLRAVPDLPLEPAHDALRATETPAGLVAATPTPPDVSPRLSDTDPRNPDRPKVDPVTGIRLYVQRLRDLFAGEEEHE